jgi:hypothetical protein
MKLPELLLVGAVLSASLLFPAAAHPQSVPAPPILVKKKSSKGTWMKAEVISCTNAAITVRERQNPRKIHTLSFSPKLREKMERLMDKGGYQFGDRVRIQYDPESNVATAIRGRPSKQKPG